MTPKPQRFSYLIQCNHCGFWTGYVSRRRLKRPKKINTICSVCHERLRHTFGAMVGSSNTRYRPGSGAHNKSTSVYRIRLHEIPSTCKSTAGGMNSELKLNRAKRSIHRRDSYFRPASEVPTGVRFKDLKN